HAPEIGSLIVVRGRDFGVEANVALEIEAVGDMIQVSQDLRRARIALRPLPFLRQLVRERVAVGVALRITARTRVAGPVPGASDSRARLQHLRGESEAVTQAKQLVETGEAGANDESVEVANLIGVAFQCWCGDAGTFHPNPQKTSLPSSP